MPYLYDTKTKELADRFVKLTKHEEKFLFLLLSNDLVTYDEFLDNGFSFQSARIIKNRLVNKTWLHITTIANVGYRLDDKIYII